MSETRKLSYLTILSGGDVRPKRPDPLINLITGRDTFSASEGVTNSLMKVIRQYAGNPHDFYCRYAITSMLDNQMIPYTTKIGETDEIGKTDDLANVLRTLNFAEKRLTRRYARCPYDEFYKSAIQFVQKQRDKVLDQIEKLQPQTNPAQ